MMDTEIDNFSQEVENDSDKSELSDEVEPPAGLSFLYIQPSSSNFGYSANYQQNIHYSKMCSPIRKKYSSQHRQQGQLYSSPFEWKDKEAFARSASDYLLNGKPHSLIKVLDKSLQSDSQLKKAILQAVKNKCKDTSQVNILSDFLEKLHYFKTREEVDLALSDLLIKLDSLNIKTVEEV